jgi:hypothetical protein
MTGAAPVTVIVEPNPGGHRFQWVQSVARVALARGDDLVLLTQEGGGSTEAFGNFLADLPMVVREPYDRPDPSVEQVGASLLALREEIPFQTYVITEADILVKRWWKATPKALRGRGAPKGILVYGRFPSRVALDREDIQHRIAKTSLAALALVRGAASRVVALVGRDRTEPGWIVKRVRDPAICTEHARDRMALRARLGLPADRKLVSVLGAISMRKSVPLVLDAVLEAGPDVDLLLAGPLFDDVEAWLVDLDPAKKARIVSKFGFLSEAEIDGYTAASDVCATAHLNKGPSGIMGKAQAAGVPVLSAGSKIRGREAKSSHGAVHTDMTASAMAAGIREILAWGPDPVPVDPGLPTADEFGAVILGMPAPPSLVAARRG